MLTLSACTVHGCILETGAAKSESNAQNSTSVTMRSVQVQTTGKRFFSFSATLNKMLCPFTLTTMFGKTYLYQPVRKVFTLI